MTKAPFRFLSVLAIAIAATTVSAQEPVASSTGFDATATLALGAMRARAEELHVGGVAVVAYSEGDSIVSWSSKMIVIGNMIKAPTATDKAANLLGVAYAKACEMASTLKDSGSGVRPPFVGEFGWQGGVVAKGKTGTLIAAFSGGPSENDVKISKAGLEVLAKSL